VQVSDVFEEHRPRLLAVAARMLGSAHDAEDAVSQTWLKAASADLDAVANPAGWLTTVLSRECLDMLRRRRTWVPLDAEIAQWDSATGDLVDSLGMAMLVLLERLSPAQRVAFVLHDAFGVPFADIAAALGTTPSAAKQLASRARRAVAGASAVPADRKHVHLAEAFLAASRDGDIASLLDVLAPDAVRQVDRLLVPAGVATSVQGARAIAEETRMFAARARAGVVTVVDGEPMIAIVAGGRVRIVIRLVFQANRISVVDITTPNELHRNRISPFG
jgi:RNA polymerase sigma-70 factor (ECF subfamily)